MKQTWFEDFLVHLEKISSSSSVTMIRFFNRKSRKKSRDFKYNTSKTSLQNHFSHIQHDSQGIVGNSDGTIPRQLFETAASGGPDYGTYSSVNTGFVGGNRPRYSSINALGSKESGSTCGSSESKSRDRFWPSASLKAESVESWPRL